ncbi:hypothetical protein ACK3TF_001878 [Chlorella vulgaris]
MAICGLARRVGVAMGRDKQPAARGPKWPRVAQKSGLQARSLLPDDYMVEVRGCLTPEEADSFVAVAESVGFKHSTSRGPAYGEAYRDNDRIQFQDQQLADHLWQNAGLSQLCAGLEDDEGRPVKLNPNIRLYRYKPGQAFGKHIDESNELGAGLYTQYTLLIYLSRCSGGETIFYGNRNRRLATVVPQPGLALLHRHGDECLEHEGAAVTGGTKYVLRSDVVFQRH